MARRFVIAAVAGAVLLASGWLFLRIFGDISTTPDGPVAPPFASSEKKAGIAVGVISRYTPTTIYQGYQPMMDYLTEATPYRFDLKLGRTYWETVELLASGKVEVAFLGRKVYLQARDKYGLQAILKPLNDDYQPQFQDAVITRTESRIRSLADLADCRVALPSQESFSGNWLRAEGFSVGSGRHQLKEVRHFEHHHTVVYQVLRGNFDAGVVRESVAEEYDGRGIRIIARSQPVPGSPIVIGPRHDPSAIAAFKRALLAVDPRKPEFAERVAAWDTEFRHGFAAATDRDYDAVQRMLRAAGDLR